MDGGIVWNRAPGKTSTSARTEGRWVLGMVLLLIFGGCAPWTTAQRKSAREHRPLTPNPDSYLRRPTNSGQASYSEHLGDMKTPRVQANAPTPVGPIFQFTSQTPSIAAEREFSLPVLNGEPQGVLAPKLESSSPALEVVRLEPQEPEHESSIVRDDQVQLVQFTWPPKETVPMHNANASALDIASDIDPSTMAVAEHDASDDDLTDGTFSRPLVDTDDVSDLRTVRGNSVEVAQALRAAWRYTLWGSFISPWDRCSSVPIPAPRTCAAGNEVAEHAGDAAHIEEPVDVLLASAIDSHTRADSPSALAEYGHVTDQLLRLLRVQLEMLDSDQASSLAPAERNYWRIQGEAMVNLLEAGHEGQPTVPRHVVAETVEALRRAMKEMESLASLEIPRAAFCTEVRGFGQYDAWGDQTLHRGQPILIYCELRNYVSKPTTISGEDWFVTRLRSKIIVRDPLGRVVQRVDYPIVEDLARNFRNDFYMHVPYTVGQLPAGSYRLDLLIDDAQGDKTACYQPGLTFRVR